MFAYLWYRYLEKQKEEWIYLTLIVPAICDMLMIFLIIAIIMVIFNIRIGY